MFDRARIRLTLWYTLILAVIVGALSFTIYRLLVAMQRTELQSLHEATRSTIRHIFSRDEVTLAYEVIAIDLVLLLVAALGAYVLAGRTLRPIHEAMERQRHFASAASHELRTPLTALQGALEVALLRERTPEEYRSVIAGAVEGTERMTSITASLLEVVRAEHDVEALHLAPLDLADVVGEAVDDVRLLAERKNQTLDLQVRPGLVLEGDASKLRGVFVNLLENAISYTPEGGPIAVRIGRNRGRAVVHVKDSGPGIDATHIPHLFEPFYRGDRARTGSGHLGLGLTLAGWIVRAHGGEIDVVSQVGIGSEFTVTLPLTADPPPSGRPAASPQAG